MTSRRRRWVGCLSGRAQVVLGSEDVIGYAFFHADHVLVPELSTVDITVPGDKEGREYVTVKRLDGYMIRVEEEV